MIPYSTYIRRCLSLAEKGSGFVSPNPMVGAVLVYENRIIGEGFHKTFGESHAEVNAINHAIKNGNRHFLEKAALFVSLEPCSHHGKTPPCTDLIIKHKIPEVVIGCKDPFAVEIGKGSNHLKSNGIIVIENVLEDKCLQLNRRFITYHTKKRPYILIKYAQTSNHFIAPRMNIRKKISNDYSDTYVHKWRSEEDAIMVGTRTVETDNPALTVRNWNGKNPLRITIDRNLRLPQSLNIFDKAAQTIVFTESPNTTKANIEFVNIDFRKSLPAQILAELYKRNILSVMIEGGNNLLLQFISENLWDEARIITSPVFFPDGIKSPEIDGLLINKFNVKDDIIQFLKPRI